MEFQLSEFVSALNSDDSGSLLRGLEAFVETARLQSRSAAELTQVMTGGHGASTSEDGMSEERKEEKAIVLQYLAASPVCAEIFDLWRGISAREVRVEKGTEARFQAAFMDVFASILFQSRSEGDEIDAARIGISRKIIGERFKDVTSFLNGTRDSRLLRAPLKLLTGLAQTGKWACRELLFKLNHIKGLHAFADKAESGKTKGNLTRFGSCRHRFIQYVIAMLANGDVALKKTLLEPKGLVIAMLQKLPKDPFGIIEEIFKSLEAHVLLDRGIGRKAKIGLFGSPAFLLEVLLPLYQRYDDEGDSVREAAHSFMLSLLIEPETRIFPVQEDDELHTVQLARRHRAFSALFQKLQPMTDQFQEELALKIVKLDSSCCLLYSSAACQNLVLDPRPSFNWLKTWTFVAKVFQTPLRTFGGKKLHDLNSLSEYILSTCFPDNSVVPKGLLSRGLQNLSGLVVTQVADFIVLVLQRCDALIESLHFKDDKQLRNLLGLKLVQRVPDVNVILNGVVSGGNVEGEIARDWTRLRYSICLRWYAKMIPQALVGRVDPGKLLQGNLDTCDSTALLSSICIAQSCIELDDGNLSVWMQDDRLKRVWMLRVQIPLSKPVNDLLSKLFCKWVRDAEANVHARSWIGAILTTTDVDFFSRTISRVYTSSKLATAAFLLEAAKQEIHCNEDGFTLARVLLFLIHHLKNPFVVSSVLEGVETKSLLSLVPYMCRIGAAERNFHRDDAFLCEEELLEMNLPKGKFSFAFHSILPPLQEVEKTFFIPNRDLVVSLIKDGLRESDARTITRTLARYVASEPDGDQYEDVDFAFELLQRCVVRDQSAVEEIFAAFDKISTNSANFQMRIADFIDRKDLEREPSVQRFCRKQIENFMQNPDNKKNEALLARLCRHFKYQVPLAERIVDDVIVSEHLSDDVLLEFRRACPPSAANIQALCLASLSGGERPVGKRNGSALLKKCTELTCGSLVHAGTLFSEAIEQKSFRHATLKCLCEMPSAVHVNVLAQLATCRYVAATVVRSLEEQSPFPLETFSSFLAVCPVSVLKDQQRIAENAIEVLSDPNLVDMQTLRACQNVAVSNSREFFEKFLMKVVSRKPFGMEEVTIVEEGFIRGVNKLSNASRTCLSEVLNRMLEIIRKNPNVRDAPCRSMCNILQALEDDVQRRNEARIDFTGCVSEAELSDCLRVKRLDTEFGTCLHNLIRSELASISIQHISDLLENHDLFSLKENEHLLLLWLEMISKLSHSECTEEVFRRLMREYQMTLSRKDCILRALLEKYNHVDNFELKHQAFLFGVESERSLKGILRGNEKEEIDDNEVLLSVETLDTLIQLQAGVLGRLDFRSSLGNLFPILRCMKPHDKSCYCQHLLYEKTDSSSTSSTKVRNQSEEAYHELYEGFESDGEESDEIDDVESFGSDEEMEESIVQEEKEKEELGSKQSHCADALDPSSVLPLLEQHLTLHAIRAKVLLNCDGRSDYYMFGAREWVESGILSYCVWSLGSFSQDVREKAGGILHRFGELSERDESFRERIQITLALRILRNGFNSKDLFRIPTLACNFISNALDVFMKPSHALYVPLNKFFNSRPDLQFEDVPMFFECFKSTAVEGFQAERSWILRTVADGIRSQKDVDVLARRHVPEMLMSFVDSPVGNGYMRKLCLVALVKIARQGKNGIMRLLRCGMLSWVLAISTKRDKDLLLHLFELLQLAADSISSRIADMNKRRNLENDFISERNIDAEIVLASKWTLEHISMNASDKELTQRGLMTLSKWCGADDTPGGMLEFSVKEVVDSLLSLSNFDDLDEDRQIFRIVCLNRYLRFSQQESWRKILIWLFEFLRKWQSQLASDALAHSQLLIRFLIDLVERFEEDARALLRERDFIASLGALEVTSFHFDVNGLRECVAGLNSDPNSVALAFHEACATLRKKITSSSPSKVRISV